MASGATTMAGVPSTSPTASMILLHNCTLAQCIAHSVSAQVIFQMLRDVAAMPAGSDVNLLHVLFSVLACLNEIVMCHVSCSSACIIQGLCTQVEEGNGCCTQGQAAAAAG